MAFATRRKQKLTVHTANPGEILHGLAVSQYDADRVEFVQNVCQHGTRTPESQHEKWWS
jgi:hypothetical protein